MDQSGDSTDTYPVSWAQVIDPGSSASFVGQDYITQPEHVGPGLLSGRAVELKGVDAPMTPG
ncbi:hypothetical protein EAS64_25865 [Trebonia kvetii]|uniref:Uncharacterized protein n=1 Tax=Trebonia kvetii TaxID=2480626 RepID=A0A6P2BVB1_9ACTN|nr:hypothetical protein [Trebonia kvetii]TVZ02251.1 hypothetical protein EAS64_25865 [Trebonia kvetii]